MERKFPIKSFESQRNMRALGVHYSVIPHRASDNWLPVAGDVQGTTENNTDSGSL